MNWNVLNSKYDTLPRVLIANAVMLLLHLMALFALVLIICAIASYSENMRSYDAEDLFYLVVRRSFLLVPGLLALMALLYVNENTRNPDGELPEKPLVDGFMS